MSLQNTLVLDLPKPRGCDKRRHQYRGFALSGLKSEYLVERGMNYEIRSLESEDWALWKEIRLEALKLHPEAFGSSYEEESVWTNETFQQNLVKNDIFGTLIQHKLVGVAGFANYGPQKLRHKGMLFTLYVKQENRNHGIAKQLLGTVIHHARTRVLQLHCSVNVENHTAVKLYQTHGFQIFGTEPRALKVDETFCDLHLMVLKFD